MGKSKVLIDNVDTNEYNHKYRRSKFIGQNPVGLPIETRKLIRQQRHQRELWQREKYRSTRLTLIIDRSELAKTFLTDGESWTMYCEDRELFRVKMRSSVKSDQF